MSHLRRIFSRALRASFPLVFSALAVLFAVPSHAVVMEKAGRTRVVLITTDPATAGAFDKLAATLQQRFAVSGGDVTIIAGAEATANRIEDELLRAARALGEADTLFAVVALPIRGSGGDRTLVPSASGTGLSSSLLLEKIIVGSAAGSAWLLLPECASKESGGSSLASMNVKQSRLPPAPGGRATITFCERGQVAPGLLFTSTLIDALNLAAAAPTVRAPWMGPNEAGFITSDVLFEQLARVVSKIGDEQLQVRVQTSTRGGGLLRVADTRAGSAQGISQRLIAASDEQFRQVMADAVSIGRQSPQSAQATAQELVAFVAAENRDARRSLAVQAMSNLPPEVALPSLTSVYQHANSTPLVRQTAVAEWREVAPAQDRSLTTAAMQDSDPAVRLAVVRAVAAAKDTSAADFVKTALADQSSEPLRAAAAAALPDVAARHVAEPALVAALKDPAQAVRIEAATALGRISPSARASRQLTDLLEDDREPRVLAAAAYATANVWPALAPGSQDDVDDLTEELVRLARENKDAEVREAALFSLKTGKRASTAPEVEQLLGAREPQNVRQEAVDALGVFAQPSSVPPLSRVARDSEAPLSLRVAAVAALAQIPDLKAASEIWMLSTTEKNATVSTAATNLTESLKVVPLELRATLSDANAPTDIVLLAAKVAGRARDRASVDPLIALLGHRSPRLRAAAVSALSQFKDAQPLPQLKSVLESRDSASREMRASAAQVLAALGTPEARRILMSGMNDPEESVRAAVATALGAPDVERSLRPALMALARDPSAVVRAAAASALGSARSEESQRALQELANDPQPSVRAAAVEALRAAQARTRGADVPL